VCLNDDPRHHLADDPLPQLGRRRLGLLQDFPDLGQHQRRVLDLGLGHPSQRLLDPQLLNSLREPAHLGPNDAELALHVILADVVFTVEIEDAIFPLLLNPLVFAKWRE